MVSQMPVRKKRKPKRRPLPPGQKLLLLLALSGICCFLTVTLLRPQDNSAQSTTDSQTQPQKQQQAPAAMALPFTMDEKLIDLNTLISDRAQKQSNLKAGVFVIDPDTGRFAELDAKRSYPAASMIKLPILVRLLQAVDEGKVKFDQKLAIRQDLIGGGSGWLQWRKPGTQCSLEETAELMMVVSDNTATNMVIDCLGGKEVFNNDFKKWGLTRTKINNWLPDLEGTNTTSPFDLSVLLARVDKGEILSPESRGWLLKTLERNKIKTLLPRGVPAGTRVADKTGDIGKLVGDAGIITTKNGKRYIAAVAVERPHNDRRANALIRRLSKDMYIGVTGDVEGAKAVIVDDEQQPAPARKHHRHHRKKRHRA